MGNSCKNCLIQQKELEILSNAPNLIIATLNYGGILKSPFEFYSDEEMEEKKLSDCFERLLPIYITSYDKKVFDWDIGKIDHKLQQERFTPLYNKQLGIDYSLKKQRLITAKQFNNLWSQNYKAGTKWKKVEPEPTSAQKDNMKMFDLICYHAIIDFVYQKNSSKKLGDLDKDLAKLDPSLYKNFMIKKFSKSFLNEDKKIEKVLKALNHIDVAFFQEPTKILIDTLKREEKFFVKDTGAEKSMIVIRKENFIANQDFKVKKIPKLYPEQKYFDFNGNNDAVALPIDNFIFISAHLSSKESKNAGEVKAFKEILTKMKTEFKDYHIILGADINSYLDSQDLEGYQIYPNNKNSITTSKKRTFLQPQVKKANKVIQQCKDHIIASCPINNCSVKTIQCKKIYGNQLLPTDQHPFDHFMVVTQINR